MAEQSKADGARAADGAAVVAESGDPQTIRIVCGECRGLVDIVGYDAAEKTPAAVSTVMATLNLPEKAARAIVAEHNPDQLLTQREAAEALAEQIVAREVPDRDASTYLRPCPRAGECALTNGGDLEVAR